MIRFPVIRPDIPAPAEWMGLLEISYAAGRFTNFGPLSRQLEGELTRRWGGPESACVLASSGTAAIAAPLIALGIRSRVLVPAFTFPATLAAVRMANAVPVVIDVCPDEWRVSAADLDAAFSRTAAKAAVVVSPFGLTSDFTRQAAVARRHGAVLVIDSAAGLGADRIRHENEPDVFEAYSLHATKPFAIGEGGAIFADRSLVDRLRSALNFGLPDQKPEPTWGINGKLSELHAAVGLAVARRFSGSLERRQRLAASYIEVVRRYPALRFSADATGSAWQLFPLVFADASIAECFSRQCAARGMETRRYYAPSLSVLPDVEVLGPCPVAESLSTRSVCLPVYARYEEHERQELVGILEDALIASLGS